MHAFLFDTLIVPLILIKFSFGTENTPHKFTSNLGSLLECSIFLKLCTKI